MMSEKPDLVKNMEDFMMIAGDAPKVYSPVDVHIEGGFTQESPSSDIFSMMQSQTKNGPSKIDLLLQPAKPEISKN